MSSKHFLPSKLPTYLRRLKLEYAETDKLLYQILDTSRFLVIEETEYDNWNGGTYGHDVVAYLPVDVMKKLRLAHEEQLGDKLKTDLNAASKSVPNEFFRSTTFELADEDDEQFQSAMSLSQKAPPNADALTIWKSGHLRLFISHRDEHKVAAKKIAEGLEALGVSGFVAHDTIEPMTTWQKEILNGLETMEFMLACITDGFHDSWWTNQEIGFALGRNVPIIRLKLQKQDPMGFIGDLQAIPGDLSNPAASVPEIYDVLCKRLGQRERLQRSMIAALASSPDFNETKARFNRLNKYAQSLSEADVVQIVEAFKKNPALHNAYWLINEARRLTAFLEQHTGKKFTIEGKTVKPVVDDDDIPF